MFNGGAPWGFKASLFGGNSAFCSKLWGDPSSVTNPSLDLERRDWLGVVLQPEHTHLGEQAGTLETAVCFRLLTTLLYLTGSCLLNLPLSACPSALFLCHSPCKSLILPSFRIRRWVMMTMVMILLFNKQNSYTETRTDHCLGLDEHTYINPVPQIRKPPAPQKSSYPPFQVLWPQR